MKYILNFLGVFIIYSCSSYNNEDKQKLENELVAKAEKFNSKNLLDSSIFYYEKALELNNNTLYLINIGGFYNMQNKPEKAIVFLDSAQKKDSNNAIIYNNRAKSYNLLGKRVCAINDLEMALKIDPNFYEAKIGLSKLYFDNDQYEKAIKHFNEIIIKEPTNNSYKFYRGKSYLYSGMYSEALTDFNEILEIDSLNADYLFSRAEALAGAKQIDASIVDFKKVIKLIPNEESTAYRNLAEIYLVKKKDRKKACEYIHLDAKLYKREVSKEDFQKYCGKKK